MFSSILAKIRWEGLFLLYKPRCCHVLKMAAITSKSGLRRIAAEAVKLALCAFYTFLKAMKTSCEWWCAITKCQDQDSLKSGQTWLIPLGAWPPVKGGLQCCHHSTLAPEKQIQAFCSLLPHVSLPLSERCQKVKGLFNRWRSSFGAQLIKSMDVNSLYDTHTQSFSSAFFLTKHKEKSGENWRSC